MILMTSDAYRARDPQIVNVGIGDTSLPDPATLYRIPLAPLPCVRLSRNFISHYVILENNCRGILHSGRRCVHSLGPSVG
jgi:hypothetical protein